MHSVNSLKTRTGAKNEDGTTIAVTTKENAIKKLLVKDLQHLWISTLLNILYVLMT